MGEDISFDGGVFEKIVRWGGGGAPPNAPLPWETLERGES